MKTILLFFLAVYRRIFSPDHGLAGYLLPSTMRCRFYPTCSQYSKKAIETYGVARGIALSTKRIMRCHPFHSGGIDDLE